MQQSKSKGSICRGRETIVTAAKSKASICKEKREASLLQQIKGFNLQRKKDTHIHTPTFLLQQSKAFNLQREREILACCCNRSKLQSAGTNTP
jgi:hypothetical protein